MKKIVVVISLILSATMSYAADVGCSRVYVGTIHIDKDVGLRWVVVKASPTSTSGSRVQYFQNDLAESTTYWSPDAKKEALSVLMAAKAMSHPVDISTSSSGDCETGLSHSLTSVNMSGYL